MPAFGASNLVSDPSQTRQPNIIACAVLTWVAALSFVAVRFYARYKIVYVLGAEDWMILAALIFSGANSSATIREAIYGLGKHVGDVDPSSFTPMMQASWMVLLWYSMSITCTKISVLLLYIRILTYHHAKYAAYLMLSIVVAIGLWYIASLTTACIPLNAFWDRQLEPTFCWPEAMWWANLGLHMATDFLIFLLPLPVILSMRIRWQQKLLLYSLFAFGFFVCIISIIRLVVIIDTTYSADFTYASDAINYWTCIELNTAVACACVMTYKPLILKLWPTLLDPRPRRRPSDDENEWRRRDADMDAAFARGPRPLTIGSRPIRKLAVAGGGGSGSQQHHQVMRESWIFMPGPLDSDAPILGADGESVLMETLDVEAGHHHDREEEGNEGKTDAKDDVEVTYTDLDRPAKAKLRDSASDSCRTQSLTIEPAEGLTVYSAVMTEAPR